MSWGDFRSVRKEPTSMECSCQREWSVGGGSGAGFIDSLVNTGRWSDGDQWVQDTAGESDVSEEVMTRSRMWFLSCVGKWTCWLRLTVLTNFNTRKAELNYQWHQFRTTWASFVQIHRNIGPLKVTLVERTPLQVDKNSRLCLNRSDVTSYWRHQSNVNLTLSESTDRQTICA